MYSALPTIESTGSSDSQGGSKEPRAAPALPPRSGSGSGASAENASAGSGGSSTFASSPGSLPQQQSPDQAAATAAAADAAVASVHRTSSAPSPGLVAGKVGGGRVSSMSSSSSRFSSSGGSSGGIDPSGKGQGPREFYLGAMDGGEGGVGSAGSNGLFHDAQDVPMPTLSVYDPERLWEYVERPLMVYMPLRKLLAKPPAVSGPTNIDELPVRCLVHRTLAGTEVAARLVDTPAERYRASFAFIYMVSAESQEHYKQTVRPLIRAWIDKVEARGGGEDGPGWLLLYVIVAPQGGGSSDAAAATAAAVDAQGKIFWWLCADFYSKTPGDRCSLVSLYVDGNTPVRGDQKAKMLARSRPSASPRHHPKQWSDLLAKVGRVVLEVFEARVRCYASELGHLDATRGMIGWDFGQFFVVKESLALMYKELQLPSEALLKYQELAALILTMGEGSEAGLRSPVPSQGNSPVRSPRDREPSSASGTNSKYGTGASHLLFGLGIPSQPQRLPASVLDYGQMRFRERLNGGGLHSLVLETQLYIFARQCALNLELKKPAEVARMGGRFMPAYYHELVGQAADLQEGGGGGGGWGGDFDEGTSEGGKSNSSTALDPAEVELFALKSSWDVVKACDRYFARALNPGASGVEPPPREVAAIRKSRVETSRFLAELLDFAQTRLLEYARLVAERGRDGDDFGDGGEGLMGSCVWELQERGFLPSQRNWIPQDEDEATAAAAVRENKDALERTGRMRVEGGVVDVQAVSGQYFWDCDEEGEVFIPPQDPGVKRFNPMKAITGGDGVPSPQKSRRASNRITDFDDDEDESDEADNSDDGSGSGAAAAAAAAVAAEAALSKLTSEEQRPSSPSAAAAAAAGGGGDVGLWLLDRPEALEDAYLQLTHSLGQHNQRAGRIRAAARCWGRRVELLLERGEVGVAQARLSNLADLYQAEGWTAQAFWALHRLARCHRSLALSGRDEAGQATDACDASYVSTVMRLAAVLKDPRVRSEGGKAAVDRAAEALLRDARSLAGDPVASPVRGFSPPSPSADNVAMASTSSHIFSGDSTSDVGGKRAYRLQCFADVSLYVVDGDRGVGEEEEEDEGGEDGRRWRRRRRRRRRPDPLPAVHVGDRLLVSCVLTSHLPQAVTLDSLSLEMTLEGGGGGGGGARGGQEASAGGRSGVGDRSSHRRLSPRRNKVLRRLESVKTVVAGEDDLSPSRTTGAGALQLQSPPPGTASHGASALLASGADGSAGQSKGIVPGFQVPPIRTERSQSLSPRLSATSSSTSDLRESLTRVPPGNTSSSKSSFPAKPPRHNGGGGRARSPLRHSISSSPPPSPPPTTSAAAGSRTPPKAAARPRPACSARIGGPVELLPGDNEVVFTLRPTMAGVITASRVSAAWGGVTLVQVLSGGGRGRGPSGVTLPSAWLGAPRPPPSAVVRPFRPQAVLQVVPPSFLPLGNEGWLRVAVTAGPDTLRGARLRVAVGRGLAWGDAEASRVRWRRLIGGGGAEDANDSCGPAEPERPAQARPGEEVSDMLVALEEVLRPGYVAEVSLRVRSTAEASSPAGGPRPAVAPRSHVVRAELEAWHSRHPAAAAPANASDGGGGGGGVSQSPDAAYADDAGVACRTYARAAIVPRLPFEARVAVTARQAGVVFAQTALVCTAPVALSLRSCELSRLEPGAEVLSDPNGFLNGESLPPGQPLRLAACLRRPSAATAAATAASAALAALSRGGEERKGSVGGGVPLAVHRLRYSIGAAAGESGDSGEADAIFVFDVCIPSPAGGGGSGGAGNASPGAAGSGRAQRCLTTTVRPCGAGGVEDGNGGVARLKLAEPRAFEFGVVDTEASGAGENGTGGTAVPTVTYQVVASPSDWMIGGLVRGSAKLDKKGGGLQVLCRVHLVPIRGGLVELPRLDVVVERGSAAPGEVEVWSADLRKVLVLPPGDSASVCQARAP